ncbi:BglG family transcription antiterminator LicT [Tetragenococcus halophilus]|uniref:BglG family transcription antiterminator LicT n=1 Tax=Tetragenococcus halophilus TaxID=51669 RepID=UPI00209A886D|nr:PRD domain-containing protein [Tetragenococcus halophilus]MCO8292576.1 PRD domain-containing protein [Tetragenococcus halophilus]
MRIIQVLNNNVVFAVDDQDMEVVVMGTGIGFQKKPYEQVEEGKIQKVFVLTNDNASFAALYDELSEKEIETVLAIINYAEKVLDLKFQGNLFITLGDHLHFALERKTDEITLQNPLDWQIKRLYKKEYQIGVQALEIIKNNLGVVLEKQEASSIALHLINSEQNSQQIGETTELVKLIQNILQIVQFHFGIEFDEESISFSRFLTHLQFTAQRVIENEPTAANDEDTFLYDQVKIKYPKAFDCAIRVFEYIKNSYAYQLSKQEIVYLTIQIQRLVSK